MASNILPHEILLNILYHLDGDSRTIKSLALTCKLFRDLLMENEPRIAHEIACKHRPGPIQFLLEATAPATHSPSFGWISGAYARGHAIEILVNALENAGLYKDQSVFGTMFSIHGRPLQPKDYDDVRRYVITMLLAVELCSVRGNAQQRWSWANQGPRWTAGFALLSQDLILHLVKDLHQCIDGHNFLTWGPSDAPSGWFPNKLQATQLENYLFSGMLHGGARGIADILSTTYDSYSQFVAVARWRLFGHYIDRYTQDGLWPQHRMPARLWLFHRLQDRRWEEKLNIISMGGVYKDYVSENDIDEWKEDVPDNDAWIRFVHDNEWSKPLRFTPTQLRKKAAKPMFQPLLDPNGLANWLAAAGKRSMAKPSCSLGPDRYGSAGEIDWKWRGMRLGHAMYDILTTDEIEHHDCMRGTGTWKNG